MKLDNKVALVTGGSRGLGKDMALRLASNGAETVITYQSNRDAADVVVSEIERLGRKSIALRLDVAEIASQTALGRVGVAEDIGGVVAFLCSEDARWVNGQRIEVSGGMFL